MTSVHHKGGFSVGNLTLQQMILLLQPTDVHNTSLLTFQPLFVLICSLSVLFSVYVRIYSDEGHRIVGETSAKDLL